MILITNAPRTADAVEQQLGRIGLPREAWDGIATSGEAGIAALKALDRPSRLPRHRGDRAILEGRGVRDRRRSRFHRPRLSPGSTSSGPTPRDYADRARALGRARRAAMHCLNPDRMVIRGGVPEACAGALADIYAGSAAA